MMVRRVVVVGLVVAMGIVAAETSVAAKSTKPLTKAQFITQANALCDAAQMGFVSLAQQFGNLKGNSSPSSQEVAAFVAAFAPIVQNQIIKTRALKPPKRDQSKVNKVLQLSQSALSAVKANPLLLGGRQNPFFAADTLARAYGLEDSPGAGACTSSGGGGQGSGGANSPSPPSS